MSALIVPGYEILQRVGQGRCGEVFRARLEDSRETAAIKVSRPCPRHGSEDLAFKFEFHFHSRLRHPHIVRAHHFGEIDDTRRYYAMEYVNTVPLAALYREGGIRLLAEVALGVCEALEYSHAQGILHGDIKPANVLVSTDSGGKIDRIRLADFGHAQRLGDSSLSSIQGTLGYMSPEQIAGWSVDARSDLYSLGVMLFEAISGRFPFPASSPRELFRAQMEFRPPSILELVPELDSRWASFLDSLISRNRENRPRSATATAERIAELLGRSHTAAGSAPASRPYLGPSFALVGRRRELDRMLGYLREPLQARTVLITGEPGVGKTRLAEEFARIVEMEGGTVYRSDARAGAATGFRVLRGIRQQGQLLDLMGQANGGEGREEPARDGSGTPTPHLRQAELERLVDSLLLETAADSGDHVFLFDSLESADLDSLAFLRTLQGRLQGREALLCLISRPVEQDHGLGSFGNGESLEIHLSPLASDDVRALIVAQLGETSSGSATPSPPLDDEELTHLASWMLANTGGVPRFVESALRSLVQARLLRQVEGGWILDRPALEKNPITRTAEERALERVHQLTAESREFLEVACVAGNEFDASLLAVMAGSRAEEVPGFLAESTRLGILIRAQEGSSRYRFVDPEVSRALYRSLDRSRRRGLHLRLAGLLEAADGGDHVPAEVAGHLEQAGERKRAREAFVRAAEADRATGAFQEAARHYRKAWELHTAREREEVPRFAHDWVRTLYTNSRFQDATRVAGEILSAARSPDVSDAVVANVIILQSICLTASGNRREGRRILASLLESDAKIADPRQEAWALVEFGWLEMLENRREEAWKCVRKGREIGMRIRAPYTIGMAELRLGVMCWREEDAEKALEWLARSHEHLVEADGQDLLPAVWGNQGINHWNLLHGRQAIRCHRRSAEGFVRQHRRAEAARSFQNLTKTLIDMGHWKEAAESLATAELLNRTVRGPREASYFEYCNARLCLCQGKLAEAREHIDRALELVRQIEDPFVEVGHLTLRGLIELDGGRGEDAGRSGEESLRTSRRIHYRWGIAKSLYLLGQAARLRGDSGDARRYLEEASSHVSSSTYPALLMVIELALGEVLAESGNGPRARKLLAGCREKQIESESAYWEGLVALSEGKMHAHLGGLRESCQSLSRAYEVFTDLGANLRRAEALVHLARNRFEMENHRAGEAAWRHARSLYDQLGVPPPEILAGAGAVREGSSLSTVHRVLEAAASVSREITTLRTVDQVLARILDVAITHLGTERGVIGLVDPATGELRVRLARNMDRESIVDGLTISRSVLSMGGREGEMVCAGDALADPRLSLHESIRECRIRSLISLPIRLGDRILGAIYMDHRELTDLFGREEQLFLRFIADMAAIGIRNAQRYEVARDQVRSLRGELAEEELLFDGTVVGRGPRMRELYRKAIDAARAGKIVLLTGPSGVGKDHLARILHDASGRTGDFVDCPLPTIPDSLIETELFGVAGGTATNVESRPGLAEAAQGGTLFLNEIADLPLALQPVLLHVLERREFRRVGRQKGQELDALIVCATNEVLEEKVADGSFREDLFYRLTECVIEIPPLRDHPEDIPELADLFLRDLEEKTGREGLVLHPLALDLLMRCPWQGNIRELRNCLGRALQNAPEAVLEVHHLESPSLRRVSPMSGRAGGKVRAEVDSLRIQRIRDAMTRAGGVTRRAAGLLGVSERTVRRWLDRYHLEHMALRRRGRPRTGRKKSGNSGGNAE